MTNICRMHSKNRMMNTMQWDDSSQQSWLDRRTYHRNHHNNHRTPPIYWNSNRDQINASRPDCPRTEFAIQRHRDPHLDQHLFDSQSEPSSSFLESEDSEIIPSFRKYDQPFTCANNSENEISHSSQSLKNHAIQSTTSEYIRKGLSSSHQHHHIDHPLEFVKSSFCSVRKKFESHKQRQAEIVKEFFAWWSNFAYHYPYWVSKLVMPVPKNTILSFNLLLCLAV